MAAIFTKNRFFFIFFNSLNILKSQCCYQTIKEQCIYNSLSVIFFTNFQVGEAATAMFDGSRGHHSWSERELYMHCSFIVW
jgi:hypothetical protein